MAQHGVASNQLTRILDELCARLGKPPVSRSDNGRELADKARLTWAH